MPSVFTELNDAFHGLPLAATIDGRVFATHGGIPRPWPGRENETIKQLLSGAPRHPSFYPDTPYSALTGGEPRASYVPDSRALARDLLWNDPAHVDDGELEFHRKEGGWAEGFGPSARCGAHLPKDNTSSAAMFGNFAVTQFLERNGFDLIIRAHQCRTKGLQVCKGGRVITVFSCHDYVGSDNNAGAAFIHNGKVRLISFDVPAASVLS